MLSPERIIKTLLPKKISWIIDVIDVSHEGTVKRYMGSGYLTKPDQEWEEYTITMTIDSNNPDYKTRVRMPEKNVINDPTKLEKKINVYQVFELNDLLYEINQLMTIEAKYNIQILDSSSDSMFN